ncbi:MAG: C25 family cysteine peptidase, partial [Myxococcota bacterium]
GGSETQVYPDHVLSVTLNGISLGVEGFYGFDELDLRFLIPAGTLKSTGNVLQVESLKQDGVSFAIEWLDSVHIEYSRASRAIDNVAHITTRGEGAIRVTDFSSPALEAWAVSRGRLLRVLENVRVEEDSGGYAAIVPTGFRGGEYVVFNPSAVAEVEFVEPLGGTSVREETQGAEYVVVAHPSLMDGARELAAYRAEQGLSTLLFDVYDVYDAYSGGTANSDALAALLRDGFARWDVAPRYLVLVGDGTFDTLNVSGSGDNLITPPLMDTEGAFFASDSGLGELGGAAGFEVAVGRLPVRTAEDLDRYLEKIRAFENAESLPAASEAFVLADNPDEGGDFAASLALALEAFGDGFSTDGVALDPDAPDIARDRLLAAVDAGTR